jgi:hypothetical protein
MSVVEGRLIWAVDELIAARERDKPCGAVESNIRSGADAANDPGDLRPLRPWARVFIGAHRGGGAQRFGRARLPDLAA